MSLYRKKPVVVEARQFTEPDWQDLDEWITAPHILVQSVSHASVHISTLEGEMCAQLGDWIIKGVKGEFYPCKPDIFEQTYEEVTPVSEPDTEAEQAEDGQDADAEASQDDEQAEPAVHEANPF